jgi:hypothetical protein
MGFAEGVQAGRATGRISVSRASRPHGFGKPQRRCKPRLSESWFSGDPHRDRGESNECTRPAAVPVRVSFTIGECAAKSSAV